MTPDKQIFYDPQLKRWKRLRRILDISAVLFTFVVLIFIFNIFRGQHLPELLLPSAKHNYKPLRDRQSDLIRAEKAKEKPSRRKTDRKASEIPFNTGEGLRAAFYNADDPASYSAFKEHVHQIDILFPMWLHVSEPDGNLMGESSDDRQEYRAVGSRSVRDPDELNKIKNVIAAAKEDTEVFPVLSSFNPQNQTFDPAIGAVMLDQGKRQALEQQILALFQGMPQYRGLSLDLENFPDNAQDAYLDFIDELYPQMHAHKLRLYINVELSAEDDSLKRMAASSDALVIMNYDEHEVESQPGPVASQTFFLNNLKRVLKVVPKEKIVCAVGNYGYDWTMSMPTADGKSKSVPKPMVVNTEDITVQEAWQRASDADADLDLDYDSLNPHYSYIDEDEHVRHVVWFLDAVTLLDEMRGARELGIQTFALWALGKEDRSLWAIWDKPSSADALNALDTVPPGHDLDVEGVGDILRVTGTPKAGKRTVQIDTDETDPRRRLIIDEHMDTYPLSYQVRYYGYHPGQVALSFDDGPDPAWTPKILDILKRKNVKGTFMMIGEEGQENVGLMQRVVREGHEIGNHTYTHPDISEISPRQLQLELNLTERLFVSKLGIQPLYFRPPYDIDEEPDTDDQADPAYRVEQMGYVIVGNKIDTDDWNEHPRKSPQNIVTTVMAQLETMKNKPQFQGSIILLHDGGGNRAPTVAALPVLIDALRTKGYEIVPVSQLMGKTTAEVMPRITGLQYWRARADSVAFSVLSLFGHFIVWVFFVGDVLMSARLVLVGLLAIIDRLRKHKPGTVGYAPPVAVLVPAYNEETVIVRTVRSVLNSSYPNLHVIVIDDGSSDKTAQVAREAYVEEIAAGKVAVLTKPNGGKAAALNYAVERLTEEFYVGIDADTVIASDAIAKLMPHFEDPLVGAVAGNAKVGNRVNLWTRWQALEYITSQNFERRALDLFNVVTVVPGAIGAWRTGPVKLAGGYPLNTVAEDADLTMSLLEQGLKVVYEDRALAFTEAPINASGLMRQRFRWSFGTLQAVWKHRAAFTKNKAMGLFALPNIVIFQMLLPLVSPFIDLMFLIGFVQFFVDRYYHPEAASTDNFARLLTYFLTFMVIDFITSSMAFSLERKHPANKGDGWLLFHIWLQRFAYRQVFSVVLFKTVKRAIDGRPFNWDKIARTAKMSAQTDRLVEGA